MMKKTFIIILLLSVTSLAQSAGNSGLSFLKFGFGARNIAMGDAGVAASNDLSALFYNPSRLVATEMNEVMFMHNEWIQDVRSEVGGIKWNMFSLLGFVNGGSSSANILKISTLAEGTETNRGANIPASPSYELQITSSEGAFRSDSQF